MILIDLSKIQFYLSIVYHCPIKLVLIVFALCDGDCRSIWLCGIIREESCRGNQSRNSCRYCQARPEGDDATLALALAYTLHYSIRQRIEISLRNLERIRLRKSIYVKLILLHISLMLLYRKSLIERLKIFCYFIHSMMI